MPIRYEIDVRVEEISSGRFRGLVEVQQQLRPDIPGNVLRRCDFVRSSETAARGDALDLADRIRTSIREAAVSA